MITYKALHGLAPLYIKELLALNQSPITWIVWPGSLLLEVKTKGRHQVSWLNICFYTIFFLFLQAMFNIQQWRTWKYNMSGYFFLNEKGTYQRALWSTCFLDCGNIDMWYVFTEHYSNEYRLWRFYFLSFIVSWCTYLLHDWQLDIIIYCSNVLIITRNT